VAIEICQVDISAERAKILLVIIHIPLFIHPHPFSVVSSEFTSFPFEPRFLIQEKSTITPTVESDTFVVVVQFKVSSPPSDNQVRSCLVPCFLHFWRVGIQ